MHERQMHEFSCFATLTYDDDHVPVGLDYSEFQRFLKRLRKLKGATRYFMCGEYGDLNSRPHFHALLFGPRFDDLSVCGEGLYRSKQLERLWPYGFSSLGEATFESAGYVARYAVKKVLGPAAADHYRRVDPRTGEVVCVEPEFAHMSTHPGLGWEWFRKYWKEVSLARDGVVLKGGHTVPVPKFYDRMLEEMDPDLREFRTFTRYKESGLRLEHSTPERLAVREQVALARLKQAKRKL